MLLACLPYVEMIIIFFHLSKLFLSTPAPDKVIKRIKWAKQFWELFVAKIPEMVNIEFTPQKILKICNSFTSVTVLGVDYLKEAFLYFLVG